MRNVIDHKLKDVSELLGITNDEALILMSAYNWREDLVESAWLDNPDATQIKAGIMPSEPA